MSTELRDACVASFKVVARQTAAAPEKPVPVVAASIVGWLLDGGRTTASAKANLAAAYAILEQVDREEASTPERKTGT